MNRYILFIALTAGILSAIFQQTSYGWHGENVDDQNDVSPFIIELTHLDVNDTNLKIGFKIINNTDHDIWLCDKYVDTFMDTDNRTLVLRTRYNLPNDQVMWEFPFPRFRYSRLRPRSGES